MDARDDTNDKSNETRYVDKKPKFLKIISPSFGDIQIDLLDYDGEVETDKKKVRKKGQLYGGYLDKTYFLVTCDIHTRMGGIALIKQKEPQYVLQAFKEIMTLFYKDRKIRCVVSDSGTEFMGVFDKYVTETLKADHRKALGDGGKYKDIKHQAGIVERLNRTIRDRIEQYLDAEEEKTGEYPPITEKIVQRLMNNYNNTVHSSISDKPNKETFKRQYTPMDIFEGGKEPVVRWRSYNIETPVVKDKDWVRIRIQKPRQGVGLKQSLNYSYQKYQLNKVEGKHRFKLDRKPRDEDLTIDAKGVNPAQNNLEKFGLPYSRFRLTDAPKGEEREERNRQTRKSTGKTRRQIEEITNLETSAPYLSKGTGSRTTRNSKQRGEQTSQTPVVVENNENQQKAKRTRRGELAGLAIDPDTIFEVPTSRSSRRKT